MMTELLKYELSMNELKQSNQQHNNSIEMDINVNYYNKVLKMNNYEIPENVNTLRDNEIRKNIFKLKNICPLV